ncbi:hypothetical protein GZH49_25370 [Nocardia terpenica]|uniref:hypothetical protein n=1 Tax=Nocardia terpenica TaxID=455432 RepID=UPI002FE41BEF
MTIRERFALPVPAGDAMIYGAPHETADGSTIITVARPGGLLRPGGQPLGIFVVRDGAAMWQPAFDATRIATLGVLTGLLSAVIATLAVLRRPPWPDVSIRM